MLFSCWTNISNMRRWANVGLLLAHAYDVCPTISQRWSNVSCLLVCERLRLLSLAGGALVQWLKLPAWKVGDRGFEPYSGLQVS